MLRQQRKAETEFMKGVFHPSFVGKPRCAGNFGKAGAQDQYGIVCPLFLAVFCHRLPERVAEHGDRGANEIAAIGGKIGMTPKGQSVLLSVIANLDHRGITLFAVSLLALSAGLW